MIDVTNSLFLQQIVTDPTRENNILDLIFTNDEDLVNVKNITKTAISDHRLISSEIDIDNTPVNNATYNDLVTCSKLEKFNFWSDKSDWQATNKILADVDWKTQMDENSDIQNDLNNFYAKCHEACIDNIPLKKQIKKNKIPHDRKVLMRKRWLLNIKLRKTRSKKKKDEIETVLKK